MTIYQALDQCVEKDLRNRKQYYSLQFLEPVTLCNDAVSIGLPRVQ